MTAEPVTPASFPSSDPVSPDYFAKLMSTAGPIKDNTDIAVAVSGGPDSMALLILLAEWAGMRGITVTALTVDHGLRPDSANEAAHVGRWCAAIGIPHVILEWGGEKPNHGIQEEARRARYELMEAWCVRKNVENLFVAHTLNDQAETFLFRMSRGSGPDGLAAMPLVSWRDRVRVVRPLLTINRTQVTATLREAGQDWVEDPGNSDRRYARVRVRQRLGALDAHGVSVESVAGAARIFGQLRADRDRQVADLAAGCLDVLPEGYAEFDRSDFLAADADIALTALVSAIGLIGGREFAPRRARSARLFEVLTDGPTRLTRTLGGCTISANDSRIRLWREPDAISQSVPVDEAERFTWDGRFLIDVAPTPAPDGAYVAALKRSGWERIANDVDGDFRRIPGPVRYGLPAVRRGDDILQVWHLGYRSPQLLENIIENAVLRSRSPISGPPFWVA